MSDQASPSVKRTKPCHPDSMDSSSPVDSGITHHQASNQLLKRRRRQHLPGSTTNSDGGGLKQSQSTSASQIRQNERHERLRKERQTDNLLILATIFVLILVVVCSFFLYHVWNNHHQSSQGQQQGEGKHINKKWSAEKKKNPPPPERLSINSNISPERDMILYWKKELEELDQVIVDDKISKSDILLNPALLPFRNGTINWRHWKGYTSFDDKSEDAMDSLFFKRSRLFDSFPWEEDEDMSKRKIRKEDEEPDPYSGKPYLDYTNPSLYEYPSFRSMEENKKGYPKLSTLGEMLSAWPQDNIDHPPTPIKETLQHFDYTNINELQEAWKYVEHQLPFKLTNVPELLEANQKWTDDYVAEQFGSRFAKGNCQESPTSFFAFFNRKMWLLSTMGLPPTRDNDFGFKRWAKHARYADHERLSSQRPHFYWQAGVPKEERYQPKDTWSFLSLELPSFSTTDPNATIFCPDPTQSKGIQCRFGERGVTAANHFDGGQNMVGMITGAKRYILSPPNQCGKLAIQTERGTALYRHSLLNLERLNTDVESDLEREWLGEAKSARAVETVLKAGEVLFIPSHWFHYIISLQKNAQCNVRSGVHVEGNDQFGGQHDVSAEGCRSLFCPDGYFPGLLANGYNCAKNIGNGIPSGMLQGILQHYTGLPRLKYILKECYGWNKQRIPLDPEFACICGYKPPRERERKNQEDLRYIVYAGQKHPGFELDNTAFLCKVCRYGRYNCCLRTFLGNKIQKGEDLTEEETKEYERRVAKVAVHREYVRNNPKDKETARQHNQKHQIKSICNDELNKEKKQRAKSHAKPRKTTHRFEMNKGTTFQYEDPVREFVDQAFEKVVKEAGSPVVSTDLLSPVFRGVVDKYASKHPNPRTVVPITQSGRQIYFREEMKRLAGKYMDKINERNGKRWLIRNCDTISTEEDRQRFLQSTIRGEYKYTQAGFAQYVVDSLAI